jgi:hypothetical protein
MARIHAVNHSATGRFVKANSGYQLRKQARERIRLALLQEFDFSSATSQVLLPVIVGHLFDSTRARKQTDRVRASNAARRLLAGIPRCDSLWP